MTIEYHNPSELYPPYANYAHAVELPAGARQLHISGLNAFEADGVTMPSTFLEQADLVWRNLGTVLASAGMTYTDLISLRFYLADAAFDPINVQVLKQYMGAHTAARTVICAQLLDPSWLIELEAIAAQPE